MNISDELFFNIIKDWEKKNISNEEKGLFIKTFMNEKNLSERKVAELIGVPRSTVNDWLTNRQMRKYYARKGEELRYLLDRLIFVLSSKDDIKDSDKTLVYNLKREFERLNL